MMSEQVQDLPTWQRAGLSTTDVDRIAARYFHADGTEQADIKAAIKDALGEVVRGMERPVAPPSGFRWIPVATEGIPAYDDVAKVLAFTQYHDYAGQQFHHMKASDFYEVDPDGDGEPGTDLARTVTHYMVDPWPPALNGQPHTGEAGPDVAALLAAAASIPREYAKDLERSGWGNRFPDALTAIFNASDRMAERIRGLVMAPAGAVPQSLAASTTRPVAIAMALQAADWSAPSIGNKALIAAAIEALASPFVGRFTLTPDEVRQIARSQHGSSNAPQGSDYVNATLLYLWERADAASKVTQAMDAEVVPDSERCRCAPPDEVVDGYCQHCGNKVGKSPFVAALERTAIAATRTAYLESILFAVRAQLQGCAADLPADLDRRVLDCLNEALNTSGSPASHTVPADVDVDALRWREVLGSVGARYSDTGTQIFTLSAVLALGTGNLMKGSVAEHFTRAVDARRTHRAG
ncbi:MAG TPA: hypothetical protein VGD46_12370 [Rhizobacter sp.]